MSIIKRRDRCIFSTIWKIIYTNEIQYKYKEALYTLCFLINRQEGRFLQEKARRGNEIYGSGFILPDIKARLIMNLNSREIISISNQSIQKAKRSLSTARGIENPSQWPYKENNFDSFSWYSIHRDCLHMWIVYIRELPCKLLGWFLGY